MNFSEIFKTSFLNGYQPADITTQFVLVTLAITSCIGLYIFFVYRLTTARVFYSLSFNISLIAIALITATIIFTIQSSIVVSLGMVGALSIVRFRTAIKDPLDLVYLFWAIAAGIICGAGLSQFAILLSLFLTVVLFVLSRVKDITHPLILVVNARSSSSEDDIIQYAKQHFKKYSVKSRNADPNSFNIVIEFRANDSTWKISQLESICGVISVSVITHDGETVF